LWNSWRTTTGTGGRSLLVQIAGQFIYEMT
jgi:hypothetical protein